MSILDEFKLKGFYIEPNVLTATEIDKYLSHLHSMYLDWKKLASSEEGNKYKDIQMYKDYGDHIFNLARKTRFFDSLIDHGKICKILDQLFDERYILTQSEARSPRRDAAQGSANLFHRDARFSSEKTLWVIALICLENITDINGPTSVIPGSHAHTNPSKDSNPPINLLAKAGDVIFIDGNLLHKATENFSGLSRWVIILTYNNWALKPTIDHTRYLKGSELFTASRKLIDLFGITSLPPADERLRIYTCTDWETIKDEFI